MKRFKNLKNVFIEPFKEISKILYPDLLLNNE